MAGGSVSEDSERSLIIGNAEALPAKLFDKSVGYVALGHLHKPQKVNGEERIRYSGSPIPLSFSEIGYKHQILDVTFQGERLVSVEPLPDPAARSTCNGWRPRPWPTSSKRWRTCPMSTCSPKPSATPGSKCVCASTNRNLTCASRSKARCKARPCAWCASPPNTQAPARGRRTGEARLIELDQLTPQELFSRAWQDSYGSEVDEQTLKDFAVLLQDVQQEDEQRMKILAIRLKNLASLAGPFRNRLHRRTPGQRRVVRNHRPHRRR